MKVWRGLAAAFLTMTSWRLPRPKRAAWREEWLAEFDAVIARSTGQAVAFLLGAPRDASAVRRQLRTTTDVKRRRSLSALTADIRYASRHLLRKPGHTVSVVACLVIGLVVSIGTFSILESLFIGDQPGIHDRRSLGRIYLSYDSATHMEAVGIRRVAAESLGLDDFAIMRRLAETTALEAIGAEAQIAVTVTGRHGPLALQGAFASGGFFRALLTERGAAGRLLLEADDLPASPPVVVVSDYFWRTQLDGSPDAIGQEIVISGRSFAVVGVAPPRFHGMEMLDVGASEASGTQLWMPLVHARVWATRPAANEPWLTVVGRMRAGRTLPEAERELSVLAARVSAAQPDRGHATAVVRPHGFGPNDAPLRVVLIAGLILLLPMTVLGIGCANVANLQLARVADRARELAVRLSLGASRRQLVRLVTLETLARSAVAVALALGLLVVLMRYVQPLFPMVLAIDWRVATFATALALGLALTTGLIPAWLVLRSTAAGQLKQHAQSGGLGHARLRAALIVAQVALSLALLAMTALVVRTIRGLELSAPAALREQMVASFNTRVLGMTPSEGRRFADALAARAEADGRVQAAALSTSQGIRMTPPEIPPGGSSVVQRFTTVFSVTPNWFDVMSVRLLAGRRLTAADDESVALVSAYAAEMFAPAGSPLGTLLTLAFRDRSRLVRIVGVIDDTPMRPSVDRPDPVIYTVFPRELPGAFTLRVRTKTPEAVGADLHAIVTSVDPRGAWTQLRRGDMQFEDEAKEMSVLALAVGAAGAIAMVLSATGLYAVMSYVVMLRRREVGVRLAIGAQPARIVALIMRQAVTLVAIGAAVGLGLSVPLALVMRATMVARVNAADPLVYAPAMTLLFVVGAIAAAVPALRAASIDPVSTLRSD